LTADDKPDSEEMISQTGEAVARSFAPLADMVVRNAIAGEFSRAYASAMEDLTLLAGMHQPTWTPPEPVEIKMITAGREAIEAGAEAIEAEVTS
jgi:hypothetical protein